VIKLCRPSANTTVCLYMHFTFVAIRLYRAVQKEAEGRPMEVVRNCKVHVIVHLFHAIIIMIIKIM